MSLGGLLLDRCQDIAAEGDYRLSGRPAIVADGLQVSGVGSRHQRGDLEAPGQLTDAWNVPARSGGPCQI